MRYKPFDSSVFVDNRCKVAKHLKPKSLGVFNANDIMPTNADGQMRFRQNSDFFYLTGIEQEQSILALFPECHNEKHREVLFLRETNEKLAIWEGEKISKEVATERSGVETVYWLDRFPKIFRDLILEADSVYLNQNEHGGADTAFETRDDRFLRRCLHDFPLHRYERLGPILHTLRAVKSAAEIQRIEEASRITEAGFRRILSLVNPGMMEYEVEAEFLHEFVRRGSRGFAYEPIIASGSNACILHYMENCRECRDGEVLLLDVAAEYGNYASDMTRTIPVNGRFTPRQRDVYDAVLRVLREAQDMLRPGVVIKEYQEEVVKVMETELIQLKLLYREDVESQDPDKPLYRQYFMHGTAHHLGLDVHDVGHSYRALEPGMVLTCEPGIYIKEENFGVRLENDILVGEEKNINLMESIPIEADEIEELMHA